MKAIFIIAIASLALLTTSCTENKSASKRAALQAIFPKGEKGPVEHFTGNAWNTGLVENDTTYNTVIGNVYFEPGARSNWYTHPSGQILIITDGVDRMLKAEIFSKSITIFHWLSIVRVWDGVPH